MAWPLVRIAAGLYLCWLGIHLWRTADRPASGADKPVSIAEMFVATLLNPKELVIGLALLPEGPDVDLAPYLGIAALAIAIRRRVDPAGHASQQRRQGSRQDASSTGRAARR